MVYRLNCPLTPASRLYVLSVRNVRSLYAPPCLHSSSGAPPRLGDARRGLLCVPTANLSAQAWAKSAVTGAGGFFFLDEVPQLCRFR